MRFGVRLRRLSLARASSVTSPPLSETSLARKTMSRVEQPYQLLSLLLVSDRVLAVVQQAADALSEERGQAGELVAEQNVAHVRDDEVRADVDPPDPRTSGWRPTTGRAASGWIPAWLRAARMRPAVGTPGSGGRAPWSARGRAGRWRLPRWPSTGSGGTTAERPASSCGTSDCSRRTSTERRTHYRLTTQNRTDKRTGHRARGHVSHGADQPVSMRHGVCCAVLRTMDDRSEHA